MAESFFSGAELDPVLIPIKAAEDIRQAQRHEQLTSQQALAEFRRVLSRLLEEPYAERMIQARQATGELGLRLRDGEIQRELWRLRMANNGRSEPVLPGQPQDLHPCPTAWHLARRQRGGVPPAPSAPEPGESFWQAVARSSLPGRS